MSPANAAWPVARRRLTGPPRRRERRRRARPPIGRAYPVQRQSPASASRTSSSLGFGTASSRARAPSTSPGVQKPHWDAPASANAACSGCGRSAVPSPSMVSTVRPWARTARVRQDATGRPSSRTVQAPQRPVEQPALTPKMPAPRSRSRRVVRASASARSTRPFTLSSSRPEVK